jgi:CRP/FNR family cyclic AMP-dependent transcriptional regulator
VGDPKIEALKKVPLFSHVSEDELRFVGSHTDEIDVEATRTLIRQGQPGDTFYVLLDGGADVVIDGQKRRTLHAGDFFGEISMLDRGPATATVTTTTPTRLMVMSHSQFRDAIKGNPDLLTHVLAAVAERLRADALERLKSG